MYDWLSDFSHDAVSYHLQMHTETQPVQFYLMIQCFSRVGLITHFTTDTIELSITQSFSPSRSAILKMRIRVCVCLCLYPQLSLRN